MIETDIFALLGANAAGVANRVYPGVAIQDVLVPYIVFSPVVGTISNVLNGPPSINNTRMQVDVYAMSYSESRTISNTVIGLFEGWKATRKNWQLSEQYFFESDTHLHRFMLEFSIWQ